MIPAEPVMVAVGPAAARARYLYTHRDRAGPAMRNKAFRLRIRPDLAGRVCPGFPWMNREAWLLRIQAFKKKRYPSILAG